MKRISAIASKSDAHRALICAALSEKSCNVIFNTTSDDIKATEKCLRALREGRSEMYCGESGSTLRFLLPVMGALGIKADFYPEGRLPMRPLSPLYEEMERMGCSLSPAGEVPFKVRGRLRAGTYNIPGNISSQYISGLLFALPLIDGDSYIKITGRLESQNYVKMTLNTIRTFGIEIEEKSDGFFVRGNQKYSGPDKYIVEGDWSNAAFILAAGAITGENVLLTGLNRDSLQGDKEIVNVLKSFGAGISFTEDGVAIEKGNLRGIEIDAGQIPDMVPAISAVAAFAEGKTVVNNAGRLRIKESDRLKAIRETVNALGGRVTELEEGLVIEGTGKLKGGEVSSYGDHRIAMMAAVCSLFSEEKVVINGADAVKKSYPGFYEDFEKAGFAANIERK